MYRQLRDPPLRSFRNSPQRKNRRSNLRRSDARDGRLRLLPQSQRRTTVATSNPDDRLLLRQRSHPETLPPTRLRRRVVQKTSKPRQAAHDADPTPPKSKNRKSRSNSRSLQRKIRPSPGPTPNPKTRHPPLILEWWSDSDPRLSRRERPTRSTRRVRAA